jgi:quercetin dioxygenase-like cupin family protein
MNPLSSDRDLLAPFVGNLGRRALWRGLVVSLVVLVALSALSLVTTLTAAQEATPSADPTGGITAIELAPGITAQIFALAPSARAPGQTVSLARLTWQPGAEIFPHRHPGTTIIGVESGTWGWTLLEGTAHVIRGAGTGATEVEDVTEPGTEVLLESGDAIFYEEDVIHSARGASDEPAVIVATLVLTSGEPDTVFVEMDMGTPAT